MLVSSSDEEEDASKDVILLKISPGFSKEGRNCEFNIIVARNHHAIYEKWSFCSILSFTSYLYYDYGA